MSRDPETGRSGPSTSRAQLRPDEEPNPPEPPQRAHGSLVVAATPEQVFALLADGERYAEWVVGATEIESEDPEFPRRGAEIHPRVGVDPVSTDGTTEVTAVRPGRHLALLAHVEPLGRARITFDLHEHPGGTLVVMEEEAVGDDLRAEAGRRSTRAIRARNAETLWRLKLLVEADAGPSRSIGSSMHPAAQVPRVLSTSTARVFAWASGLRNDRVFHPKGVAFSATARLRPAGRSVLGDGGSDSTELEAIVRVSRGIGLPHPLPDFNGVAVRLLDAHGRGHDQDLLMVSAPAAPLLRHVLLPSPTLRASGYTTILPYRTPDGLVLFAAEPIAAASVEELAGSLPAELRLVMATLGGSWNEVAGLTLHERMDSDEADALRFDPWNTGPDLLPAGLANRLRLPAYAASQAARRP